MNPGTLLFAILSLGVIAWAIARVRAAGFAGVRGADPPRYHGWFAALGTVLPATVLLLVWQNVAPGLATRAVTALPLAGALPPDGSARSAILAEARAAALHGSATADPLVRALATAYAAADAQVATVGAGAIFLLLAVSLAVALVRTAPTQRARVHVERAAKHVLRGAALAAIVITVGIVAVLIGESWRFFAIVSPADFLLGTHWSPQAIDPARPGATLGAVPLFWGTFFIGVVIAQAVAVPLGLMSALHLSFQVAPATRRRIKPVLELLAGIPTVVYGYIAALTVAPAVRDAGVAFGIADASAESALAAGLVMGIMLIPLVFTLSDDALHAVPRDLRDASLALGATTAETVRRVILPAALPGVVGGVLLSVSRAVGETMIVVMAASSVATLTLDPLAPGTTVTRQIVDLLTGEAMFDSPKTLAAFALGLVLFGLTLLLNLAALVVVRRYRAAYE